LVFTAAQGVILSASLWDGSTRLAVQPFDSFHKWFYFTGLAVPIAANTSKVLTVTLDLGIPYTDGLIVTTGLNVKVAMTYLKAVNSQGLVSTQTGYQTGNDVYVFKSLPTFTTLNVPSGQGANLSAGATTSLYKLAVAADAKGPISLKQLEFLVAMTGSGYLNNFRFFRGNTDITDWVNIQTSSGTSLEGDTAVTGNSNVIVVTFFPEEVVLPGQSYDYTLKATPHGFAPSNTVFTVLPGESFPFLGISSSTGGYLAGTSNSSVIWLNTLAGQLLGGHANIIWSDESAPLHNDTVNSSSPDWFNGYLLPHLPLDAITIVAL